LFGIKRSPFYAKQPIRGIGNKSLLAHLEDCKMKNLLAIIIITAALTIIAMLAADAAMLVFARFVAFLASYGLVAG